MKILSVVGTLAMFLVGGGIVVHGVPALHHAITHFSEGFGGFIATLLENGANRLSASSLGRSCCWR